MKRLNSRGFAHLELIVLAVVVLAVGIVGFRIVANKSTTTPQAAVVTTGKAPATLKNTADVQKASNDLDTQPIDSNLDTSSLDTAINSLY